MPDKQDQEDRREADVNDDIFGDPTIARAIAEDPVFRFLAKSWRQLAIVVLAIGAVFYAKYQFERTHDVRMAEASNVFSKVSSEYSRMERSLGELKEVTAGKSGEGASAEEPAKKRGKLEDDLKEIRRKMSDLLAAMQDTRAPYDALAALYRGLTGQLSGDLSDLRSVISGVRWSEYSERQSKERFISELAGLALARGLLDADSTYAEGRQLLQALAEHGRFVEIAAAIGLARISFSKEEKAQALMVLERLASSRPEQRELLKQDISRLSS